MCNRIPDQNFDLTFMSFNYIIQLRVVMRTSIAIANYIVI